MIKILYFSHASYIFDVIDSFYIVKFILEHCYPEKVV